MVVALLVLQPDFGQTMLIALVWGALFFMAGMRLIWVGGLGGVAGVGLVGAYFTVPHVAQRIQRFLDPARATPSTSTSRWSASCAAAGSAAARARAPSSASCRRATPTSSSRSAAEEFGIVLCLMLLALFAFIVLRALRHALRNDDPFMPLRRRRASPSCSACSRPSTWRSTCT